MRPRRLRKLKGLRGLGGPGGLKGLKLPRSSAVHRLILLVLAAEGFRLGIQVCGFKC